MSRVEDDRQAQRAAERLVQEKQLQESKSKQLKEGASAFSKLVHKQQQAPVQQPPKTPQQQQSLGKSVLARLQQEGKSGDAKGMERQTGSPEGGAAGRRGAGSTEVRAESRQADAKVTHETRESRTEEFDKNSDNAAVSAQAGRADKGPIRADADGGGKGGGDGKDKKEGELAAGLRFNPALRAPVPVAQPKSTAGSERLRAIANEIAQKIVERVRVGTNAAGNSEFQIDLRGDVLGGMSIKVSAKNGKISAVFSGKDRETLKMLEGQRDGLKNALAGRGLTLESLKVEAKS